MYEVINKKTGKRLGFYPNEGLANDAVLSEVLMYIQCGVPAPCTVFDFTLKKPESC